VGWLDEIVVTSFEEIEIFVWIFFESEMNIGNYYTAMVVFPLTPYPKMYQTT